MIRSSFKMKINYQLNRSPIIEPFDFRQEVIDFHGNSIGLGQKLDDEDIFLKAKIPHELKDNAIHITCSPGEATNKSTLRAADLEALLGHISSWVGRIRDDLLAAPEMRAYTEVSDQLQKIEERLNSFPEKFATTEQIANIHKALTDMEDALRAKINDLEIDAQNKEKQIKELRAKFDDLHKKADAEPRLKSLCRWIGSRLYKILSDPKIPQIAYNVTKVIEVLSPPDTPQSIGPP